MPAFSAVAIALVLMAVATSSAQAAAAAYPDLKTQAPRDLRFDTVDFSQLKGGSDSGLSGTHRVLRFSNSVWNAGEGALVVRGDIDSATRTGAAYQLVIDSAGDLAEERPAGSFYWHPSHDHYHYEQWGVYQLWSEGAYNAWLAGGEQGPAEQTGAKTTSCMLDEEFMRDIPGTRATPTYDLNGCFPPLGQNLLEGISVGWADTYDWYRPDQWIVLDGGNLADGSYVLRSVVDPTNQIKESAAGDPARESRSANAAIRRFKVQGGALQDSDPPDGTVTINGVDRTTQKAAVKLDVIGRDDVSGPAGVRISNSGAPGTFVEKSFTDWGSTPNSIAWNLADAAAGGNASLGPKTVHVQIRDASGKWGPTVTDTIELQADSTATPYSNTVRSDGAAAHWKLDDAAGASRAGEEIAGEDGWFYGGPALGAPGLLGAAGEGRATRFDGTDDYVYGDPPSGLPATNQVTLEAWIKADTLPIGVVRSIFNKPNSYALRTNGSRLEFVTGSGLLATQSGVLEAGRTYHVVATYDGATQRLFVDGAQRASSPHSGTLAAGAQDVYIATSYEGGGFFQGTLDEPAIYATALSPDRVLGHYDAGRAPPQPPAMPTSLAATPLSSSRIRLDWTDNANNESAFVIERSTQAGFPADSTVTLGSPQDAETYLDITLTPNTTYHYRIRARNNAGLSDWATAAQTATKQAPLATTGTPASVGAGSATLAGSVNPRGTPTKYYFEYGPTTAYGNRVPATDADLGAGTAWVTATQPLTGLQPGTTYHFRIVARSDDTVVRGASASFRTLAALTAPGGFTATPASGDSIDLIWADAETDETGYEVQRSPDGTWSTPAGFDLGANATGHRDSGLAPATTYWYRVRARRGSEAGPWSAVRSAQTLTTPTAQTGAATEVTALGARLGGRVDPRGNATTYWWEYGPTTGYGSRTPDRSIAAGATAADLNEAVAALEPSTTYNFRLVARSAAGTSSGANVSFKTLPAAPALVTATGVSPSSVTVTWTDESSDETGFAIERDTSSSFSSPTVLTTSAGATAATDSGLLPNATYYYRVRARRDAESSAWSAADDGTTQHASPGATTGTASSLAQDSATVTGSVDPKGSPTTYRFEYGTTPSYGLTTPETSAGAGRTVQPAATSVSGLVPGTTYYFRLIARNEGGTTAGVGRSFSTLPGPAAPSSQGQLQPQPQPIAPPPLPQPEPPRDVEPPRTAVAIPSQTLAGVLRRGVSLRIKTSEPGRAATRVLIAPSALGRRSRQVELVVGRSSRRLTKPGTVTVRVKLSPTARRILHRRQSAKLWVETTVTDSAGNRTRPMRSAIVLRSAAAPTRR